MAKKKRTIEKLRGNTEKAVAVANALSQVRDLHRNHTEWLLTVRRRFLRRESPWF